MRNAPSPARRAFVTLAAGAVTAAIAGAGVVTAAAVAVPTGSAAVRGTTATVPACLAASLVAWIDTNGNGAAGTIFYKLRFTNLSGHRCTVRGYPGVSAAGLSGHSIGPGASRSGMAAHTVSLNPGATASANLGIVEAGNFPPAICRPTTAAGLRVFAPSATLARFVPFPFAACTRQGNLRISPVASH